MSDPTAALPMSLPAPQPDSTGALPMTWGHWKNPVIYMSRYTAREVWRLMFDTDPDLYSDLRFGQTRIPVLFDDRMELGTARLEEAPDA
jgi:hypothetical protein